MYREGRRAYDVRVQENLEVAKELLEFERYGWAVIVYYYASIHLANSYLCEQSRLPDEERWPDAHYKGSGTKIRGRSRLVRDELPRAWRSFYKLETMSRTARYECGVLGKEDADQAKEWLRNIAHAVSEKR